MITQFRRDLPRHFFIVTALLTGVAPTLAHAALQSVGPSSTVHGFPEWYQDAAGIRMAPCLDPQEPLCPNHGIFPEPEKPVSFPENFPDGFTYWTASAAIFTPTGIRVSLTMNLRGDFLHGELIAGERRVISEIKIQGEGLSSGTYRITHPWGVTDATVRVDGLLNHAQSLGELTPENFSTALRGPVGPFLSWDPSQSPLAPRGFAGDPITYHRVVGSPFGTNSFQLERRLAPQSTQPLAALGFTDLFLVGGKIAETTSQAPIVTTPVHALVANISLAGSGVPIQLSWNAIDPDGDLSSYEVQQSVNGAAFASIPLPTPLTRSIQVARGPGRYQIRARAIDAAGNRSEWTSGLPFSLTLPQQDSVDAGFTGSWRSVASTGFSEGIVKTSNTRGSIAQFRFTGSSISWISTQASNRGIAEVYLDRVKLATVDLYTATSRHKRVVFSKNGLSTGAHTLKIVVLGRKNTASTDARVDVDAFAVSAP